MSRIAYVNGRFLPWRRALVPIEDRGFQFADGVYEVMVRLEGRFLNLDRHLDRLERSLSELRIGWPVARRAIPAIAAELSMRNRLSDALIYLQVTRGVARREHGFPPPGTPPTLVMTARRLPGLPRDLSDWAVAAITCPDERWARCDIKSTGLLANVLAKQAAREAGAGEAILVDQHDIVTEGASSTVWMVDQQGLLHTRPLDHAVLPGCTRAALRDLLEQQQIRLVERAFSLQALRQAREIFVTSASSYIKPVTRLDGRPVGDGQVGAVTRRLHGLYAAALSQAPAAA